MLPLDLAGRRNGLFGVKGRLDGLERIAVRGSLPELSLSRRLRRRGRPHQLSLPVPVMEPGPPQPYGTIQP